MKIGETYHGTITGVQSYGAFVELESGTVGLIHISEIKTGFVEDIHHYLKKDQKVHVQVVDFDEYSGKASLSLRSLEEAKQPLPRRRRFTTDKIKTGFQPLAQLLPIWIKEGKEWLEQQKKAENSALSVKSPKD